MFAQVRQIIDGRILVTWFYHVDHELVEHHSVEVFEPGVDSRIRLLRVFSVERMFSFKLPKSNKIISIGHPSQIYQSGLYNRWRRSQGREAACVDRDDETLLLTGKGMLDVCQIIRQPVIRPDISLYRLRCGLKGDQI